MGQDFYEVGSKLAVPGLESTMEYGDVDNMLFDRFPGAVLINDRRVLEPIRVTSIDGVHATAEIADSRQPNASRHGETAGLMLYRGRTIGLTGNIDGGSIPAVRDVWTKLSGQFGTRERDMLIHPPHEVPVYVNEVTNPSFTNITTGWTVILDSGTPGGISAVTDGLAKVGRFSVTSVGSGAHYIGLRYLNAVEDWRGEDVFFCVRAKVHAAATAATSLRLRFWGLQADSTTVNFLIDEVLTPGTGNWIDLSGRITADQIRLIDQIGASVEMTTNGAGTYTIEVDDLAIVLVPSDAPSPSGYFDGNEYGFEWAGTADLSKSYGPCYAVNRIIDLDSSIVDLSGVLTKWQMTDDNVTVNEEAIPVRSWRGQYTGAGYGKSTKDNTTTSRVLSMESLTGFEVSPGRLYRWSIRLNVLQKPATGDLKLRISWVTSASPGVIISNSDSSVIASLGEGNYEVQDIAPTGAYYCVPSVLIDGCITALAVFELMWADPCLIDISEFDTDPFFGSQEYESPNISTQDFPARKLIPRPFLIKSVRHASDNKSDEQQPDGKYRRSFTIGLRASDPRIYVVDERNSQIQLSGTSKFVARQAPADFTLETSGVPVPTGYTYEGHYITHPGTGSPYKWSQDALPTGKRPLNGVGFKAWPDVGSNSPASDIKTRMYRSAEAYTYTAPRVILGGAPCFTDTYFDPSERGMNYLAIGSPGSQSVYYNDLTILLKRVASGTWLELRWNSMSKAAESGEPAAPYAFELWCSHNTAGTPATTTRLATFDYTSADTSDRKFPFKPNSDPMFLTSWLLGNIVYWELWTSYPHPINVAGRIESGSFTLPSGLISVVGSAVAGSSGWSMKIAGGATAFPYLANGSPTMRYFESSDANLPPVSKSVSVIGSIDTPHKIVLRGDLVDPIISISVPEFDGYPSQTSVARIIGTVADASPITIDLAGSETTVTDQLGVDRYDLLATGSSFLPFRPGANYITLQAKSWGSYPAHLITSWRDALKSG